MRPSSKVGLTRPILQAWYRNIFKISHELNLNINEYSPLSPPPPSLSKGMTALLTSPAPWNKILFSASFFLVTLNDANIPATQTEAVPNKTSKPGHQRISSFVFHFYSKSLSRATEKSGKKRESEFIFTQDYKTN